MVSCVKDSINSINSINLMDSKDVVVDLNKPITQGRRIKKNESHGT